MTWWARRTAAPGYGRRGRRAGGGGPRLCRDMLWTQSGVDPPDPRIGLLAVTERLPLFPLGSVLFPGLVLPLHIFEERYRALARDLLALPEDASRRFGVVAIRDGHEVAPSGPDAVETGAAAGFGPDLSTSLHTIGCTAEVASMQEKGVDGTEGYEIVATGTTRFRLLSVDATGSVPDRRGRGVAGTGG
jgi:Lon protease-like protein